jgi:hypothetical protein
MHDSIRGSDVAARERVPLSSPTFVGIDCLVLGSQENESGGPRGAPWRHFAFSV